MPDCQTRLFAVITARQQSSSFPCCVSTKAGVQAGTKGFVLFRAYKTFLLSFKVHYQQWAQPFQAAQRHRKGPNHSVLALLDVWKAATPFSSRELLKLGVVAHACNPNSWEAEAGGMRGGQPGSHARPCLKKSEHWSIRGQKAAMWGAGTTSGNRLSTCSSG